MKKTLALVTLFLCCLAIIAPVGTTLAEEVATPQFIDLCFYRPLSEVLEEVSNVTGYTPEYSCCTVEGSDDFLMYYAGNVTVAFHEHRHLNDEVWLNNLEIEKLMTYVSNGDFNYEWHPVEGKSFYDISRGYVKMDGIQMPFEIGYSEYKQAWQVAAGVEVVTVDLEECIYHKNGNLMVPSKFFAQAHYQRERANIKYLESLATAEVLDAESK